MRREQVHKLVLNQLITPEIDLQPLQSSDRSWLWAGYNYIDDENVFEKLAVRFKNPEKAQEFYTAVQAAITDLQNNQSKQSDVVKEDEEEQEHEEGEDEINEEEYGSDDSDETKYVLSVFL